MISRMEGIPFATPIPNFPHQGEGTDVGVVLLDVDAFLDAVRKMPWYTEQIVHGEDVPAREARYGTLDRPLDGSWRRRWMARG